MFIKKKVVGERERERECRKEREGERGRGRGRERRDGESDVQPNQANMTKQYI